MQLDFEQWRDLCSPIYDVHLLEPERDSVVDIDVIVTKSQGLMTANATFPAQRFVHDPAARKDVDSQYLHFARIISKGGRGMVDDTEFDITPDSLRLVDMSLPYQAIQTRNRSLGTYIPHSALGFARGEEPKLTSLDLNSPAGRLLLCAHTEMLAAQNQGPHENAALLEQTFLDLVGRFMLRRTAGDDDPQDLELPLSLLLRDFVGLHLGRPDLDIDKITSAFNVSRATVYRHFDEEGGILRHIRNRRLDRCFFELARAKPERGIVSAIAKRWHFTDATHFNRLFRERFGVSPSACLANAKPARGRAPTELMQVTKAWFDQFRNG
ncbi:helix-turn-helix domain-containing protein [Hoeflea sp.]|uniref:helix-turn-helix domain-containing protein n=1 Tax=Hoeflea sp. TaxID=1940281 RepID=UPI003B02D641